MRFAMLVGAGVLATGAIASPQNVGFEKVPGALGSPSAGSEVLDRLPLRFVENRGQWDTPARFVARRGSMTARLERSALVVDLRHEDGSEATGLVIRLAFEGARGDVEPVGEERLAGVSNFFLSADPERWRTGVPGYGRILYRGLHEGIDLRLYESDDWLEYDLHLSPGAELGRFSVSCEGIERLELEADGTLVMHTALGPLEQSPPRTWAVSASGERLPLECEFVLLGERRYGFHLPERQEDLPVVIDPQLRWSTFYGGVNNESVAFPNGMTIAPNDDVLVAGLTGSGNLPTTPGVVQGTYAGNVDGYVARLSADGSTLVWATYLGGTGEDKVNAVICDGAGDVLVGGRTDSADFPVMNAPYPTNQGNQDGFLARISSDGLQLLWSTYLGGAADDSVAEVVPDGSGALVAAGGTFSPDFPTTVGVYQPTLAGVQDAFVCRVDTTLVPANQIVWSTYLGGAADEDVAFHLAHDGAGGVIVTGRTTSPDFPLANAYQPTYGGGLWDQFIAHLESSGTTLTWSTFLGGSGGDNGNALAIEPETGNVIVGGWTQSANFPATLNAYDTTFNGGGWDAYVTVLDPNASPASQLLWSSYLGGSSEDGVNGIAAERGGGILLTGPTMSANFPCTPDAYDATYAGSYDAFVARLDRTLIGAQQLTYCSLIGRPNDEAAFNVKQRSDGSVVLGGWTRSTAFPTTTGAYDTSHNGNQDLFITCLDLPVRAYCFGTGCPCGNDDWLAGCTNSTGAGASLVPIGSASAAADDLAFQGRDLLSGQAALLFVANNAVNGGAGNPFGDGLRCAGGGLVRLGVRMPNAAGVADWGPGMAAAGGWTSGDTRRFQVWYRDPVGSPCGNSFNLSHGIEVEFVP